MVETQTETAEEIANAVRTQLFGDFCSGSERRRFHEQAEAGAILTDPSLRALFPLTGAGHPRTTTTEICASLDDEAVKRALDSA